MTNFCLHCGKTLTNKRSDAKYCSDKCRSTRRYVMKKKESIRGKKGKSGKTGFSSANDTEKDGKEGSIYPNKNVIEMSSNELKIHTWLKTEQRTFKCEKCGSQECWGVEKVWSAKEVKDYTAELKCAVCSNLQVVEATWFE